MMNDAPAIPRSACPHTSGGTRRCTASRARGAPRCSRRRSGWRRRGTTPLMLAWRPSISDEARAKYQPRPGPRPARPLPGADVLVPQHQHLPRSALGAWPGNVRRGPVPDRAPRRGVHHRPAGGRPEVLKTLATAKHFAVHSGPEADAPRRSTRGSARTICAETYLPHFEMGCAAGAYSVMAPTTASTARRVASPTCCARRCAGVEVRRLRRRRLRRGRRHLGRTTSSSRRSRRRRPPRCARDRPHCGNGFRRSGGR